MNEQDKLKKMFNKHFFKAENPAKHPYTCEITGLEVDRPCWECVIYKQLDRNCKWRPKN